MKQRFHSPELYLGFTPPPETVSVHIGKLGKGSYTLKIVAENAYGMQSEPITQTLAVK